MSKIIDKLSLEGKISQVHAEEIEEILFNREKALLADIENKVKKYLLENHDHYGDVPFKKGDPYIQSMDFERFLLKIINKLK